MYKFCPHCGKPLVDGAGFCPHCGARIVQQDVPAPQDSAQSAEPMPGVNGVQQSDAPPPSEDSDAMHIACSGAPAAPGTPATAKTSSTKWQMAVIAAAAALLLIFGAVLLLGGSGNGKDAAVPAETTQPQNAQETGDKEEKTPTPKPTPETEPEPTPEAADENDGSAQPDDGYLLTYSDMPWYGAWKNADDGTIMIWESVTSWANESYEQLPDGGFEITLTDPRDNSQEHYTLSADWNRLEWRDADSTVKSVYVMPEYADAVDPLPNDWWGYYRRINGEDSYTSTAYLTVDAFRIGDRPYKDVRLADNGGAYSALLLDPMDGGWPVNMAVNVEADGVQYLLFMDENGTPYSTYALEK